MGDYDVQMLVAIEADPSVVRDRLTTVGGIATWWSDEVDGAAERVGDRFGVAFPDAPMPFEFTVATVEDTRIEWDSGEMPPAWAGTTIRFDLAAGEEGTLLRFEHKGFDADSEAIAMVTPTWAYILDRLKRNVEHGGDDAYFRAA